MAAVFLMPCKHCALQKDTALSAVPEPCQLCLTRCDALPPGFDVCGSSRSSLHWTSLPLPDTCPVGFIFVWLAKTDIQAAFQQMGHWVSHCLSASCNPAISHQIARLTSRNMMLQRWATL